MKNRFKEVFYYSRRQRRALLWLYLLCVLLAGTQVYLRHFVPLAELDQEELSRFISEWNKEDSLSKLASTKPLKLFDFDPNLATDSALAALGLSEKTIRTIINYRAKGGYFRAPEDLMNIYGIDSSIYLSVKDNIKIPVSSKSAANSDREVLQRLHLTDSFELNSVSRSKLEEVGLSEREINGIISFREKYRPFKSKEDLFRVYNLDTGRAQQLLPYSFIGKSINDSNASAILQLVDINHADSITMLQLKGVGPYFAGRIVSYRKSLGGYYDKSQLLEIHGIDSINYHQISNQIKIDKNALVKMNLNTAGFSELLRHPYLNAKQVRSIVRFREEYRQFTHVDELMNLELIDGVLFSKIANYLAVDSKDE